jgi:hypothetical protein
MHAVKGDALHAVMGNGMRFSDAMHVVKWDALPGDAMHAVMGNGMRCT